MNRAADLGAAPGHAPAGADPPPLTTALSLGLWNCECCGLVSKARAETGDTPRCPRCLFALHSRKPYNWLYLAMRSERLSEPVLIWPALVPTAKKSGRGYSQLPCG